MEEFIQQLTHDSSQFENQWSDIATQQDRLFDKYKKANGNIDTFKIKILDAMMDYVLAEPNPSTKPVYVKILFIENVVKRCAEEPQPPLSEIVRIVRRILDCETIFNQWYLSCIKAFHFKFRLCQLLTSTKSYDLIESFLQGFLKHTFPNDQSDKQTENDWQEYLSRLLFSQLSCDANKLNYEETMVAIRPIFQQIFRHAVRMSHLSRVWKSIIFVFKSTLPNLFDTYVNPTDAQLDFSLCIEAPVCEDYIFFLSKSYNRNPDLIKNNFSHALLVIERLLLMHHIREARFFVNEAILSHFETAIDLEALIKMFIRVCPQIPIDYRNELCKEVISDVTFKLIKTKCSKKLAPLLFELALVLLDLRVLQAPKCAEYLFEKSEFYPWKDLASRFTDLVRLCAAYDTIVINKRFSELDSLTTILRVAIDRAKTYSAIFRATHSEVLQAVLRWTNVDNNINNKKTWSPHVYRMGETLLYLIDRRQITTDICTKFIEALRIYVTENEAEEFEEMEDATKSTMNSYFTNLNNHLGNYIELLKTLPYDIHSRCASLILLALSRPFHCENGQTSLEYSIIDTLWRYICPILTQEADIRLYEPCVKRMHSLASDEDEAKGFEWWSSFWNYVAIKVPDIAADYVDDFFQDVIERKDVVMASLLYLLYNKHPEAFHARLDDIINALHNGNIGYTCSMSRVFSMIVQERPQFIKLEHINRLMCLIETRSAASPDLYFLFQGLSSVANAQPHLLDQHRALFLRFVSEHQNFPAMNCLQQYFVASTIVNGQQSTNEYLTVIIDLLKKNTGLSSDIRTQIFHTCQLIGVINKQALQAKRTDLLTFDSYSECRMLIDFIDGNKMSEENQLAIKRTRDEITQMEKRVIKTEQDTHHVTKVVKRQELQITNLGARVDTVDNRLTEVVDQVVAQAREIERIDAKTLSYVPMEWGRQVCKLLNQRTNNDWRLLGKRFGYSSSELRHWSLQADPTMALLNEWFMTHKTDEATYGLVKMLDEIGREDVTKIIRDAVAAAGELIPDDMPVDIKRLPPVFLSYQWGVQEAVLKLKNHLEEAGYASWMDTGQMGGGDKLFSKIDAGIRGAKVVVCCMNSAYAQSDNCSREVHLTISTGKPLIPLQMEKQKWPPEGALGPIMSEYLFIRFYDRNGNDPNFWPADKFAEILGQIRYYVAPDPDMISNRYRNWFVPRVDNLIFLQPAITNSNSQQQSTPVADSTPLVVTHPQVMISYQWDRQSDIIALYNRLTQLGYRCWLDIFQMGGGDSLFEKIDAGIRNAKCVLACITPKYTISINCRREMALADALKKIIVPLYLEDTSNWPPPGPMSMVFADKSFIDFRQSDGSSGNRDVWTSKEFDKVLVRLQDAIPEVHTERPRQNLLEMKRPTTASTKTIDNKTRPARVKSAPALPQSRACSLM